MIAEITFLINQKILKIEEINNEYYISFHSKEVLNNELKIKKVELRSQQLILRCISNHEKIKLEDLIEDLRKYKLYIESYYEGDCIYLGYIERRRILEKVNTETLCVIAIVLLIPTLVLLVKFWVVLGFGAMLLFICLVWILSSVYLCSLIKITKAIKVKTRTEKAKEEYAEWLAFIDFIKDYSQLNERKLQELEIWDDYLTYSIAFGITKIDTLLKK